MKNDVFLNDAAFVPAKKKRNPLIGSHIIILFAVLFVLLPTYIMLITSFTSAIEANNAAFRWWPESGLTLSGYIKAFTRKRRAIRFCAPSATPCGFICPLRLWVCL